MDNIAKLAQLLAVPPKSIDLIPGDGQEWLDAFPDNPHTPFLFVEGNLGVPEKVLYKAYMASVKTLGNLGLYRQRSSQTHDLDGPSRALQLTSVILLANSAHQSALNLRKSIILYSESDSRGLNRAWPAELEFIAALLSVKQCAKVSVIWHYRRALLARIFSRETPVLNVRASELDQIFTDDYFISGVDLTGGALQTEFELTAHACEVYPRNYFAWYHRCSCFQSCLNSYTRLRSQCPPKSSPSESNPPHSGMIDLRNVISSEVANAKIWIERHVSDYSAVDYVCCIFEALESNKYQCLLARIDAHPSSEDNTHSESNSSYASELLQHALDLVQSYPSHESLWLYLRRALQILASTKRPNSTTNSTDVEEETGKLARAILADAAQKCLSHREAKGPPAEVAVMRESHLIGRHSLRFLLWQNHLQTTYRGRGDYGFLSSSCQHFRDACMVALSSTFGPGEDKAMTLLRVISSIE